MVLYFLFLVCLPGGELNFMSRGDSRHLLCFGEWRAERRLSGFVFRRGLVSIFDRLGRRVHPCVSWVVLGARLEVLR